MSLRLAGRTPLIREDGGRAADVEEGVRSRNAGDREASAQIRLSAIFLICRGHVYYRDRMRRGHAAGVLALIATLALSGCVAPAMRRLVASPLEVRSVKPGIASVQCWSGCAPTRERSSRLPTANGWRSSTTPSGISHARRARCVGRTAVRPALPSRVGGVLGHAEPCRSSSHGHDWRGARAQGSCGGPPRHAA